MTKALKMTPKDPPGVARWPGIPSSEYDGWTLLDAMLVGCGMKTGPSPARDVHDVASAQFSAAAGTAGATPRGILVPFAALDAGSTAAGGAAVFTRRGGFVDALTATTAIGRLGATYQEGPLPYGLVREETAPVGVWLGEDTGSDLTASDPSFARVDFAFRTLGSLSGFSRQLLQQAKFGASATADRTLLRSIARAQAVEIDRAAINGSGASNQPTGILNTSGIGSVAIGTNGGVPTYAHVVDLEAEVAIDNAEMLRPGFLTTPAIRRVLRKAEVAAGSGVVWSAGMMLGRAAEVTNNVPSNLVKGTSTDCHAVLYGSWEYVVVHMLPVLDIVVDDITKAKQGLVEAVVYSYLDIKVVQPSAFCAIKDARVA